MVKKRTERGGFITRTQLIEDVGLTKPEGRRRNVILAVDDDPDILDIYLSVLSDAYTVVTADSGAEALKKQSYCKPDLIIMDVMMEGPAAGLQTAVILKEKGILKRTPLLFITCINKEYEVGGDIEHKRIAAECEWLSKPVRPKILLEKVAEILAISHPCD